MKTSVAFLALVGCLTVANAAANPHLVSSAPADHSTLSTPPAFLELTFSESVRIAALSIQKDRATAEAVKTLPNDTTPTARINLPPLTPGGYAIVWRAVGQEGRVTVGVVEFTVAAGASTPRADQK
jgi:methionine-rich copper-binding protein CopC